MHILKVIHGYPPLYNAGSEVYSQSLCAELSKKYKVSIFTREENTYEKDFNIRKKSTGRNIDIYYINLPREKDGYRHHALDEEFSQLLTEIQPDIAHVGHLNHLSTGVIDVLSNKQIPIVFTLHDFWLMCPRGQFLQTNFGDPNYYQLCEGQEDAKCATKCYKAFFSGISYEEDLNYWSSWIKTRMEETKRVSEKIDIFVAPSKYLMKRFQVDFLPEKSKIIYLDYGFPLTYLKMKYEQKREKFTFGYIGTHIPAKGINILIKAFKKLQGDAALKIWGREKGQSTIALKELSKTSRNPISFMGEYVNKDLADVVFSQVDCIVVPSIWGENSPLVIHESQQCKIPVITANFGGMSEYVKNNINGLLFEHRSEHSLIEKMQFALDHPSEIKELGKKGYLYSENGDVINIKDHCEELEKIYYELIVSKNAKVKALEGNN
jgi:glycosyltransferase involved in cell wall biosynthesis